MRGSELTTDYKFSYEKIKGDRALLYYERRRVKVLKGKGAIRFLSAVKDSSKEGEQLLIAKATGNFKRGNEKGQ